MEDYPLLKDIVDKKKRQKDIASGYADLIIVNATIMSIDWKAVNEAILGRWKPSGLARIKTMAWKMLGA